MTTHELRLLIERDHPTLTIEAQCEALGLPRSSYYYVPIQESEENLVLMRRIEELHYTNPEYGYRKIHATLRREGCGVNEKRVERLCCVLGFRSILPRPNLSKPAMGRPHYAYLLNGMWIVRPDQVHSMDITFIPLRQSFVYLVSVTDWFSRFTLAWELSNTLTTDFCLTALERVLKQTIPEYVNTDQGSQFTSDAFINCLMAHGIKISTDGKGRAIDNVYQERSWWSLKYEKIYPNRYETVGELYKGIDEYIQHFNCHRPHQALLYRTPYEVYHNKAPKYAKGEYKGFIVKSAS